VIDNFLNIETTLVFQVTDNVLIGFFYVYSLKICYLVRELSFHINRAGCHLYTRGSKHAEVIFAESWSLVNDACASVSGNVVIFQDNKRTFLFMLGEIGE